MAKSVKLQEVAIDLLKPYGQNAKIHPQEQVEKIIKSIEEFGFITPCVIDADYNIIVGHGRVMASKQMGLEKVPCVFVEGLTEAQRKAYILADNRLGELGEWDMDIVFGELEDLQAMDFDIDVTGFEMPEEIPEVFEDDFEPVVPTEPRTKLGDLWKLGSHRLICGDATDAETIDRLTKGVVADICVTSPPYNAGHMDTRFKDGSINKSTQKKYLNDDDKRTDEEYYQFISTNILLMTEYSEEVFYNMGVVSGSKNTIFRLLNEHSDIIKDLLYWQKDNPQPQIMENVIATATELIIAFGKNNTRAFNHFKNRSFHGVISGSSAGGNKYSDVHKATFPLYLPSELIQNFTEKNGTVLDCFGGTGTTMIACEELGRKCYMSELEPRYCDIIIDRWETLTGEKAVILDE